MVRIKIRQTGQTGGASPHLRRHLFLGLELTIVAHALAQIRTAAFESRTRKDDESCSSLLGRFDSMEAPAAHAAGEAAIEAAVIT
jgi:hypothetical protein